MRIFQTAVYAISRVSAAFAGIILIGMVCHILYEIILGRSSRPRPSCSTSSSATASPRSTFLALGYALRDRQPDPRQPAARPVRGAHAARLRGDQRGRRALRRQRAHQVLLDQRRARTGSAAGCRARSPRCRCGSRKGSCSSACASSGCSSSRTSCARSPTSRRRSPTTPTKSRASSGSHMEAVVSAAVVLGLILVFLGLGIWVFAGLFLVSITGLALLLDMNLTRIGTIAASICYRYASTWELAAIPMFIWMGEIIFRTDISDRLFRGLTPLRRQDPRAAAAHQHPRLHAVRRRLRLERGHGRDDRQDHDDRARQARLRPQAVAGLAGRRRQPGAADPAVDRHDRLRHPRGGLRQPPLRGGRPAGPDDRRALLGLHHAPLDPAPRGRAQGQGNLHLARPHPRPRQHHADHRADVHRARLDLQRHLDAVGGGGGGRLRRR